MIDIRSWQNIARPTLKVLPDLLLRRLATPNPVRDRSAAKENSAARDGAPKAVYDDHGGDAANRTKDGSGETNKISVHRVAHHTVGIGSIFSTVICRKRSSIWPPEEMPIV
jgi:hypothetical protein